MCVSDTLRMLDLDIGQERPICRGTRQPECQCIGSEPTRKVSALWIHGRGAVYVWWVWVLRKRVEHGQKEK
jgi:hypothetical protein